ncbi:MAG TPA: DUF2268 domain-containing protein [Chloroflexi bacterium]|nr:DUF2268 domain-containing protein [Chloroflexota bacterium]
MEQPITDLDALSVEMALFARADVEAVVTQCYGEIVAHLPSPDTEEGVVCIYPLDPAARQVRESMGGVVGECVGGNILLRLYPDNDLARWLPYHLAHEYHHTLWGYHYFYLQGHDAPDLLALIVSEGAADSFAHMLYPDVDVPWVRALAPDQEAAQWAALRHHLAEPGGPLYERFMFGDAKAGTPPFTGYTIGYHIVQRYLRARPEQRPDEWLAVDPWEMLAVGGYDGAL